MQTEIRNRLNREFETPRLKEMIGTEARRYTATEAQGYITAQVDAGLKPLRAQVEHANADLQRFRAGQDNYEKQYKSDYAKLSKATEASEKLTGPYRAKCRLWIAGMKSQHLRSMQLLLEIGRLLIP